MPAKEGNGVWNIDETRKFLEHLRPVDEPLYAAYVLILILGLRRGEVLGLAWDCVDLDGEQLWISRQLNRVRGELLHRETTKTEDSTASLPLFGLCIAALRDRQRIQEKARQSVRRAGRWAPSELRRSSVSLLSDNGVPLEEISRLVGHSSAAVTELVYRKQIRPVTQGGPQSWIGSSSHDHNHVQRLYGRGLSTPV